METMNETPKSPGLLESFRGAFARKKAEDASDAKATWSEYRQLLIRANHPKRGDAERLVSLVEKLGLSEADVVEHVATLDEFMRTQNLAAGLVDAEAELRKLLTAQEVSRRRFAEVRQAHFADVAAVQAAEAKLHGVRGSVANMEKMRERCPDLLGDT